ncbi:hypothetical protein D3H65_00405 [Paraflavitalea soli]|uniref:Uncharacterized protein n=1 Tax=Paraflavitalea soli TaxID=2315862 RepID=A0A3B7MPF1_9BACT|nr:hypothetical protein D3H65_00405 [Paraflavitalea soli]
MSERRLFLTRRKFSKILIHPLPFIKVLRFAKDQAGFVVSGYRLAQAAMRDGIVAGKTGLNKN